MPLLSRSSVKEKEKRAFDYFNDQPRTLIALSFFTLGCASIAGGGVVWRRYFRRFPNNEWITPDYIQKNKWVKGVVTSVGDSDNFRLYHTPGIGWRWPLKFRRIPSVAKDLKDNTLHIRMAGVDAPEAAHFGRESQPYSAEALDWLKGQVDGKTLYCRLLRRDQYGRIVSLPILSPRLLPASLFSGKCVSIEMVRAGFGTTYEQSGAEYGPWGKEEFLRLEQEAKNARRGMWAGGVDIETPAQYKKRHASPDTAGARAASATPAEAESEARSGWRRWLRLPWSR